MKKLGRLATCLIAAVVAITLTAIPGHTQSVRTPAHSLQWVCDQLHAGPVTEIHALLPKFDYTQGTCGVWDVATFGSPASRDGWASAVRAAYAGTGTVLVGSDWGASSY